MKIDTFIGYTHTVERRDNAPFIDIALEHEEYLIPVEDFLEELVDCGRFTELHKAISASDVTDVLILRGW